MAVSRRSSSPSSSSGFTQPENNSQQQSPARNAAKPTPQRSFNGISKNGKRMGRPPKNPPAPHLLVNSGPTPVGIDGASRATMSRREYLSNPWNPYLWHQMVGSPYPWHIDTRGLTTVVAQPKPCRDWMTGDADRTILGTSEGRSSSGSSDDSSEDEEDECCASGGEGDEEEAVVGTEGSGDEDEEVGDEEDVEECRQDEEKLEGEDEADRSEKEEEPVDKRKRKRAEEPEHDLAAESSGWKVRRTDAGPTSLRRLAQLQAAAERKMA